jgi:hypothetical protein
MNPYGIQQGKISQLRQRFEQQPQQEIKRNPPPKPPKPKHLSRPNSMVSVQHRVSLYEENPFLDVPNSPVKSKSDSAIASFEIEEIGPAQPEILTPILAPLQIQETTVRLRKQDSRSSSPPSEPSPQPPLSSNADEEEKRRLIVQEIIETEKSYLQDLVVLKEVYVIPGYEVFSNADIKLLFGNLDQVIEVSKELSNMLENYPEYIGECFTQMVKSGNVDEIYRKNVCQLL